MKVKPEHYAALTAAITPNRGKIASHREAIVREGKAKDVDKRVRWDLLWAIPRDVRTPLVDAIYRYANDDHLDTALRAIVRDLAS